LCPAKSINAFSASVRSAKKFALYLHAKPDRAKAEEALKKIIAMGHDVKSDGSIFDCGLC
jgi:hypothetical protein